MSFFLETARLVPARRTTQMTSPLLNQPAPDVAAQSHNGEQARLADYRGESVVMLYFYPMDGSLRKAYQVSKTLGILPGRVTYVIDKLDVIAEGTKRVQARNKIAERIAAREVIALDDLYGLVKDHPEYWSNDGVHFNGKGIAVEAEQVANRIVDSLK